MIRIVELVPGIGLANAACACFGPLVVGRDKVAAVRFATIVVTGTFRCYMGFSPIPLPSRVDATGIDLGTSIMRTWVTIANQSGGLTVHNLWLPATDRYFVVLLDHDAENSLMNVSVSFAE